ncbi:MAG: metal-dependent hydrolase [Flavobacteriaceae bacterium]|nr:metal-dependent hydrolase [Flavobacteriaceae bacterium]|tara:strand:+ start:2332 stop:3033 length:702 start_codon:yes stop_codon:yes gene_type:complete
MHSINYGSKDIFFEIKRSDRKTLAIEVHPDSSVHIIAPEYSSITAIEKKVVKRARWITKQQLYFEQFLPRTPQRKYVSGETHFYLGKSYLLKIRIGDINQVKLKAGQLQVTCKETYTPEKVKQLVAQWYYKHAEKKFQKLAKEAFTKFKEYDFDEPQLEIRRMAKRWGSCNTVDKITINPELIKAPSKCIEYVLVHEMCHFVVPKHNKAFYRTLSLIMPNWKKWKDKLENLLA